MPEFSPEEAKKYFQKNYENRSKKMFIKGYVQSSKPR